LCVCNLDSNVKYYVPRFDLVYIYICLRISQCQCAYYGTNSCAILSRRELFTDSCEINCMKYHNSKMSSDSVQWTYSAVNLYSGSIIIIFPFLWSMIMHGHGLMGHGSACLSHLTVKLCSRGNQLSHHFYCPIHFVNLNNKILNFGYVLCHI
jgi:hypothetical protein